MSALEMLTKAADLVETQDEQNRLMETTSPSSDTSKPSNHINDAKCRENENGKVEDLVHEINRPNKHLSNGRSHTDHKQSPAVNHVKDTNNLNGHGVKDEINRTGDNSSRNHLSDRTPLTSESSNLLIHQQQLYHQYRLAERSNGTSQRHQVDNISGETTLTSRRSPDRYQHSDRRTTSPTTDRVGEKQPSTKPMVLLQHPSATTLSSVGSTLPGPGSQPVLQTAPMHHQFLYPMMYQAGAALDPSLGHLNRGTANTPKESEVHASSPNGSPNTAMAAASTPMHMSAGFMYPFANQALMMGARTADLSPFLFAGAPAIPSNLAMFQDHYKRILEGMPQFPAAYHLQPNLAADPYFKSLMPQGIDGSKDPLSLSALGSRPPHGITLAGLQGQPVLPEHWMRFPEQLNAVAGVIRPHDGMSPRSGSPYTNKRRSESPGIPNGGKVSSGYPYHGSIPQTLAGLNEARAHARSPASYSHRSRSPHPEVRKPEMERTGYPSHSRDAEREPKSVARDLASTSAPTSHTRNSSDHLSSQHYSITDERGRKITMPAFYNPGSMHLQPGYSVTLPVLPQHERSPSPQSRASDDPRAFRRTSQDRSPGDHLPNKRRSLDSHYTVRHSPTPNDRHNSRPASPTTNGQIPTSRHQLVNGVDSAAEFAKANPHLMLSMPHRSSPNTGVFGDGRDPTNGSPAANPYLAPYFGQHLIGGLPGAAGTPFAFLSPYAQALAATGKGSELNAASLASLYKANENGPEYQRIPTLPYNMPLSLFAQQQQLLASAGRTVLPQEYAAALKAHSYFSQATAAKEGGKTSPAREKHPGLSQPIHPSLLGQPGPALSPSNVGLKSKHASSPMQGYKGASQHIRLPDSHSPTPNVNLNNNVPPEGRRYLSPQSVGINDRQAREGSPKQSTRHYRPNPMLHQHADDMAEHRNRKLKRKIDDEIAVGEEASNFLQGKQHQQARVEHRERIQQQSKEVKKDPKRRKQIISDDAVPDIEEHFRRSLGKDYKVPDTSNKVSITGTVDDHFKKALGGEVWNKLRTTESAPVKNEPRDVGPHTNPVLPSYSAAMSGSVPPTRGYTMPRLYEPYMSARERYQIQNMSGLPGHHRRLTKSPPDVVRGGTTTGSTVLYPTPSQPSGPVRQRIKAKTVVFPDSAGLPDMANWASRASASSLGSKGSTRTISGSSGESLPTVHTKRSPSPTPVLPSTTTASPYTVDSTHAVPVTNQTPGPYPYGHVTQSTVSNTSTQSHSIMSSSTSSRRESPSRNIEAEESSRGSPGSHFPSKESSAPEPCEAQSKESGKIST